MRAIITRVGYAEEIRTLMKQALLRTKSLVNDDHQLIESSEYTRTKVRQSIGYDKRACCNLMNCLKRKGDHTASSDKREYCTGYGRQKVVKLQMMPAGDEAEGAASSGRARIGRADSIESLTITRSAVTAYIITGYNLSTHNGHFVTNLDKQQTKIYRIAKLCRTLIIGDKLQYYL
ncbi:hypothetical protein J6590_071315 [Homalodisca vitripennis]|nr:hypothetical protein J6590_071315 [Homalodisca vitripennis]